MKDHSFSCKAITALFLFAFLPLHAYNQVNVTDKFLFKYHPSGDVLLPYRLFIPDIYDTTDTYPMVLTLHGAGECGTDNRIQIELNHIATCWADSAFQKAHPAFIVSPQCPGGSSWTTAGVRTSVIEILDSLLEVFPIDTNRIYITGLSMGGNGTWDYLALYPGLFAAAVPVCGWYDSSAVKYFRHIPVWNNHGGADGTVPVSYSRMLITAYENLNLPVVYTQCNGTVCNTMQPDTKNRLIADNVDYIYSEYKNVGHNSWDNTYTDTTILEWMFSKRKRVQDVITFAAPYEYKQIAGDYTFRFDNPADSGYLSMLYSNDLGYTWDLVKKNEGAIDTLEVNTEMLVDGPFTLFKVQLSDTGGTVFGADYSGYYNLNNSVDGIPLLRFKAANTISPVSADSIPLLFLTGDAEEGTLDLTVYYKNDDTASYEPVHTYRMETSPQYQERYIRMNNLSYGKKARLKFELTDYVHHVFDSTNYFVNNHNKPSAIPGSINEDEIWIFPNPARDEISIHIAGFPDEGEHMNITLFDLAGRIILTEYKRISFDNRITVNIAGKINSGVYLLRLHYKDKVAYHKIVIE